MRVWWVVLSGLAAGCPSPSYPAREATPHVSQAQIVAEPAGLGHLDDRLIDFRFEGGQLELELYRQGSRITQVARNRYAVPVMLRWTISALDNATPASALEGVTLLPPAAQPLDLGESVILAELDHVDQSRRYTRTLDFRAKFGDPRASPTPYAYRLPYPTGLTFSVLQGFHGAFSHRGSNEYAVDFDCPVATPVVAARDGVVVAYNDAAQGSGTTPEFLDYKRTNFVLVLHDDGTLGEYMHLAPSGIVVKAGQRVGRGESLALSGNTGFSSTPHLHFQVMTATADAVMTRSFPFKLVVAPGRIEEPMQGQRYSAWE
ncbi:MAG: M23 family metallopeptidase [Deltaproteobacteria bacterium]|nr:M23 family metallopeptidase [Deltaproteobacteria bacterium]MDQ3301314.1 M23 family metallopeptidase [Myxococcota bacterium]